MNPHPPVTPLLYGQLTDFPDLWRTLNRHKWSVFGVIVLFAIIGLLYAFSARPVYQATTTILVEARPNRPVQVQEVYDPGFGTLEYYFTQTELLRSRDLIGKVVDELDLASNADIVPADATPSLWDRFVSGAWLPLLPDDDAGSPVELSPEKRRQWAVEVVRAQVRAALAPRTQLMEVKVQAFSPELAARIANALGDVFVNNGLETRLEATERATRWLTQRLGDLRDKLERSEKALQAYREEHQLVNVGGTRGLYEEGIMDNARKLRDSQRRKTELASTYWKIQQAGSDDGALRDINALMLDPNVQKASEALLGAEQSVKQLEERYGSKHPQMSAAQARLQAATNALNNQLRIAANGIKAEYEIAAETERALLSVVQSSKEQIRKLDERDHELRALEREADANRELYELFLKRYKETDTTSTLEAVTARVVDQATVPDAPIKPNKKRIVGLWVLCGLIVGLLLATLRHLLSENVRSPEHLEQSTQLPVISVLPPVPGFGRSASGPALVMQQPRAPFSEGVRSIRASLHLSDVDRRMKKVMFTSAVPQEGKSSLASCFAAVLGPTERVILVEADLRAPSLKKIFGISKQMPGLVELLSGKAKFDEAVFVHPESGAHVLPVAQIPANPAEVISSAAFGKLIDALAARYDRVIIDTPPCQVASDTLLLARRMDAVLFVIHGTQTGMRTIQTAIKHLRAAQAPLLGHILNQVDARKAYGYDGSYYAYGQYGA